MVLGGAGWDREEVKLINEWLEWGKRRVEFSACAIFGHVPLPLVSTSSQNTCMPFSEKNCTTHRPEG